MTVGDMPFPDMPMMAGVRLSSHYCGIRNKPKDDVVLIELPEKSVTRAVFTQNDFAAAPVVVGKQNLADTSHTRYIIINAGNANAVTGQAGIDHARACCQALADIAQVNVAQVLPLSTGVIGEPLPHKKIIDSLPLLYDTTSQDHWLDAARGIMTTDTQPKGATASFQYQGHTVVVNGIAKGAGMIRPNMATMLGFVFTNAPVAASLLDTLSKEAANLSFNRITIDGDTSTNDTCTLTATHTLAIDSIDCVDHPLYAPLRTAIIDVYQALAQAIVRDGEGATKFITLKILEGTNDQECLDVAYAIAHSPLVKTAFFASDPNWGRIVAAIGYAGLTDLDTSKISIWLNDELIVEQGARAAQYTEQAGQRVMNEQAIVLSVTLGRGQASQVLWTSDLSHDYVTINADYRT